jgi:hypothetical protein
MPIRMDPTGQRIKLRPYPFTATKKQADFLRKEAKKRGCTMAELFRSWVDEAIEKDILGTS